MDSRHGLDYIVENAEYTTKLGAGMLYILILRYLKVYNIMKFSFYLEFKVQNKRYYFRILPNILVCFAILGAIN